MWSLVKDTTMRGIINYIYLVTALRTIYNSVWSSLILFINLFEYESSLHHLFSFELSDILGSNFHYTCSIVSKSYLRERPDLSTIFQLQSYVVYIRLMQDVSTLVLKTICNVEAWWKCCCAWASRNSDTSFMITYLWISEVHGLHTVTLIPKLSP